MSSGLADVWVRVVLASLALRRFDVPCLECFTFRCHPVAQSRCQRPSSRGETKRQRTEFGSRASRARYGACVPSTWIPKASKYLGESHLLLASPPCTGTGRKKTAAHILRALPGSFPASQRRTCGGFLLQVKHYLVSCLGSFLWGAARTVGVEPKSSHGVLSADDGPERGEAANEVRWLRGRCEA